MAPNMAENLLTDRACKSAKPKTGKNKKGRLIPYRLNDGGGLSLRVMPNGAKYWQYRYRYGGKENTLQIGVYGEKSLAEARGERDQHRKVLAAGKDPITARRVEKSKSQKETAETFAAIADEWLKHRQPYIAAVTHERNAGLVRRILLPKLGRLPIREIDITTVLSALKAAEGKGRLVSARRARTVASQIFVYAISSGRATENPAAKEITHALKERPKTTHHAALQAEQIGGFLRALDNGKGANKVTAAALKLMLYTGLRDGALRGAKWKEIDFDAARWTVPPERMKRRGKEERQAHSVPLPAQALAVLRDLQDYTGRGLDSFVFASTGKNGFLAENTLRIAMHRLGFEVTAHGFRSLVTDALYNANGFRSEWIERQMHHKDQNEVRAAYLRTDFYAQRVPMMQWWADACEAKKHGRTAPPLPSIPDFNPQLMLAV
jgi:integrase